ncbi:RNA-2',3'-PO4:RNA-5'-OH ligase [Olavius algarvensis Delta 1 endosymbiont]|nr:RNA-2',3'-PO4:RNA-5'-OH ligase [Olavius algarvensis Delta 1 endosymbiont]
MEWIKDEDKFNVPVKSWCQDIEEGAMAQAANLAKHPVVFRHVALMPDCHQGYGMPIGGVIACKNVVIPNAVGVDIGCGMGAVRTSIDVSDTTRDQLRDVVKKVKETIPCGEGRAHKKAQHPGDFDEAIDAYRDRKWFSEHVRDLACRNLGTLGGGNHFIEIQAGDDNRVWLMIHSGSRHLGNVIARFYNGQAFELNRKWHSDIPNKDLAFLPVNTQEGQDYRACA